MIYSNKIIIQILSDILIQLNIKNIVLSPGSRNAPFFIHFFNHPNFNCYNIVDERSAGFIALGMSQCIKQITVLCCTSGSASVNYYPAIVEAFYQNIPLLIITADRPKEYVDIFDGQTIRQYKIFHKHTYGNFEILEKKSYIDNYQKIKQAILICMDKQGPVHINMPLSEPLYEINTQQYSLIKNIKIKKKKYIYKNINWELIKNIWINSKKIMFLCGMQNNTKIIENQLTILQKYHKSIIVLCESTSNLKNSKFIQHIDSIIFNLNKNQIDQLAPDLLITLGQNIISKKIKSFLRIGNIINHWHIDTHWFPNTYFCLTEKINLPINFFLKKLIEIMPKNTSNYQKMWKKLEKKRILYDINFMKKIAFSDLKVYNILSKKIPKKYIIQFGNSLPIRYAQIFNFYKFKSVFCNRGVSGIDGSLSTSIGFSIKSKDPVIIIIGDLSFFYDINAFWNNYIPSNFRLILINNSEGNIFKFINTSMSNKLLENFFIAKHNNNAKKIAKHFNIKYYYTSSYNKLIKILNIFFITSKTPKILEINTSSSQNAQILTNYMQKMNFY